MPVYKITDPDTGRKIKITGDTPPTEQDINNILSQIKDQTGALEESKSISDTREEGAFERGYKAAFPRAGKALDEDQSLREAFPKILLDASSLPGRAVSSLPALIPGGEKFSEALARKKGKEGTGLKGVGGDIIRDPALLPGIAGGAVAGGVLKGAGLLKTAAGQAPKLLPKMLFGAGVGTAEGLVSSGVHGVESVSEGSQTPKEALKSGLIETGVSALGGAALPALGEGARKVGEGIQKKATGLVQSSMKPLKGTVKKGFKPENVLRHGLGGTFEQTVEKSSKRLNELDSKVDDILMQAAEDNPGVTISPLRAIDDFISKVDAGDFDDFFGDEDQAIAIAEKFRGGFKKKDMLENINLDQVRKAKQLLGRKAFKKGVLQTEEGALKDRVGQEIYQTIRKDLESIVPDIAEPNRLMSEIIPVKQAAEEAIERFGNRNKLLSFSNIATVLGAGAGGAKFTGDPFLSAGLAGGALLTKNFLDRGRGAALTDIAGKAVKSIPSKLPSMSSESIRAALRGLTEDQQKELFNQRR